MAVISTDTGTAGSGHAAAPRAAVAAAPFRLALAPGGPHPPGWLAECARLLAGEPGLSLRPLLTPALAPLPIPTVGAQSAVAPRWDGIDALLELLPPAPAPAGAGDPVDDDTQAAAEARSRHEGEPGTVSAAPPLWRLCDAQGNALGRDWPLLDAITQGQGIALQLLQLQLQPGAPWQVLRTLHRPASPRYRCGVQGLPQAVLWLVRQAVIDVRLGVAPGVPVRLHWHAPPSSDAGLVRRLRGAARAWFDRQRSRWLSEFWSIGVIDAPIDAWMRSGGQLPVRWITRPTWRGHWADPMGVPGDDGRLNCEYVDEASGLGHIEQLTLDGTGLKTRHQRLALGAGSHVSFPLIVQIDGQRLGLLESSAHRDCVLYRIDADGRWTPWVTMLRDVALADPALFTWEGRYWLAGTDVAVGEHDNLCLYHAERLEGPWLPHANNPVKIDITGARMAGGCFELTGTADGRPGPGLPQLIRPAQDCLGDYGSGLTLQRIVRCTPTEYAEETLVRIEPQPHWPGPDGLHTLSAWGERTLIDAKRHGVNPVVLWRKLRQRFFPRAVTSASAPAPSAAPMRRVCVYVPHLRLGGGETSLLRLVDGFVRAGLAVDLVVHSLATAELTPPAGAQVIELGADGTLSALRRLVAVLRERRPTWLLSGFPHTNVAAVAAVAWAGIDCACVVSEHAPLSLQIAQQANWRYRLLPPLVRWAYRRAGAVVAVSGGVRDDLVDLVGPGLNLHIIANPVLDDHAFGPAPSTRLRVDESATEAPPAPLHPWLTTSAVDVVLSVSRLSVEKDIPTLLRAFAELQAQRPATRLLLVGEGPERPALEHLIAELDLTDVVQLAGRIHRPMHWMQRAAVFALASRYEGFGNVLIEALACGMPVVSTDCPVGPREILADGRYGMLVPVGDWQAMAAALGQALDERRPPPGAIDHARSFTTGRASAAYRQVFDSLVPQPEPEQTC